MKKKDTKETSEKVEETSENEEKTSEPVNTNSVCDGTDAVEVENNDDNKTE